MRVLLRSRSRAWPSVHRGHERADQLAALAAMATARRYSATEACAAGIVTEVAAEEDALDRAIDRAQRLAGRPGQVLAAIKRGLYGNTLDLLLGATAG